MTAVHHKPPLLPPCLTRGNPSEKKGRLPRPEVPSIVEGSRLTNTHMPAPRPMGGRFPSIRDTYTNTYEPMRSRSHRRVGSMQRRVALHTPRPSPHSQSSEGGGVFVRRKSEDRRSKESHKNNKHKHGRRPAPRGVSRILKSGERLGLTSTAERRDGKLVRAAFSFLPFSLLRDKENGS